MGATFVLPADMRRTLIEIWRRWIVACAGLMPIGSPGLCAGLSALFALTALLLLPRLEGWAEAAPLLGEALRGSPGSGGGLRALRWAMELGAGGCAWIFQARCLQLCHPEFYDRDTEPAHAPSPGGRRPPWTSRRPGLLVAGMPVSPEDLRTSILVTGVTGSAKTAGILMPVLAQLFAIYREETEDELSRNEWQKLGAFIPEVKGDLLDACIYLAHEAGRCVSRDVIVISPSCRIPVVRYRDERGRRWYLSARGGSGGSDAGELLPRVEFPPGHPRAGRPAPPSVFEDPADFAAIEPELAGVRLALGERRPRFVGWRWDGGRLWRASHTAARDRPEPLAGADGGRQWADPPRTLGVDGVVYVDNGVHYNLVDAGLPPAEAAERLTRLAAMARGGGGRGENDYFYEQGRKVIGACIALHRAVEAAPCTAVDIVRLATHDQRLPAALARLEEKIARLRAAPAGGAEPDPPSRELPSLEDLARFFRDEWARMVADGKTANVIKSTISAAFDALLQDPSLAETFCRPSTFSFEDIAQRGKIVGLVPGDRYAQLGRLLGTACKLDFQSAMLARNGRPDLNGARLVVYFADECHKYVASGSAAAGDPYFMNLSRSNNVANVCATQSYAWIVEVIGREAANVYISAFGVQFWLQQTDPETCRRAAEICGKVTREKVTAEHDFDLPGFVGALGRGRGLVVRRRTREEERERFRPEDFAHLDVGEIIAFNKGRPGRAAKVSRGRARYHFCTERPAGLAAVNDRVREYYRELLENLAHARGQDSRWDCGPEDAAAGPARHPPAAEPFRLTRARIERDRADFRTQAGSLDAAVEELGGGGTLDLAIAVEEARRGAAAAERPEEAFGAALSLGPGGIGGPGPDAPAPLAVPPDAVGLPYAGDLPSLAGRQARWREARGERKRCA